MTSQSAMPTLTIAVLGALDIRVGGLPIRPLRGRTGEWLLALLVLRQGREVPRDWLAATLWPDSMETQARANLRRTLTDLRQALGEAGDRILAPTPHTLSLSLTPDEADIVAFDVAIRRGDAASLERAVTLYRGPFLENCLEEWALEARTARQQDYLNALQSLANEAVERGEGEAVSLLRRLLVADPYRESAYRMLMECLAKESGFAAVTEVYRDLRLQLRRDLNADPDPETSVLYQKLRAEARQRALEAQEAVSKPAEEVSVKRASAPAVGRLPRPLTPLIGRRREIAEIGSLLECHRLVTLTGTGGLGKTRLAIQVAEEQAEAFAEGVWFVGLAALSDVALVPQTVASVLGVHEEPGRAILETLTEYLGSRSLLLVLDNCEHLLEACAHFCATLLSECSSLHILATSRQATSILGEVSWRVPTLVLPERTRHLETLQQCESVRLFVERATFIMPNFALTERNAQAVVQICQQLDGIPLAIELAAARVRVLSAEQVATRLKDRFRLLSGGNPTAMPRHQTLRACLDWSYDLLSEEDRRLLQRLSVFAGGWMLEAAEAVCADENLDAYHILDILTSLTEKSLVIAEEDFIEERRYHLLETVRQYVQEHLRESGEQVLVSQRHCEWYLALAEQAEPQLVGPEQAEWFERLETEHDNLRACIAWCQEEPTGAEAGLRIVGALWRFWYVRGYQSDGRERCRRMLQHTGAQGGTPERAKALHGAGVLTYILGDYREAQSFHVQRLAITQQLGDRQGIASALGNLGTVAYDQADYVTARAHYKASLEILQELGSKSSLVGLLSNLGNVALEMGELSEARSLYEASLTIARELGNKWGMGVALINLGAVAMEQQDYSAVRSLQEEALIIWQELGDRQGIASTLGNLANAALEEKDYSTARSLFEESLTLLQEFGHLRGIAGMLEGLALLASAQQQPTRAARLAGAVDALREEIGAPLAPTEQIRFDKGMVAAQKALGKETFTKEFTIGRGMVLEQAVAFALESSGS